MTIFIWDENFVTVKTIDDFDSLLWTERYNGAGDFELYTSATPELIEFCKIGYHIHIVESSYLMIIENTEIDSGEEGANLIVKGRSLESMLDRRIIWKQTNLKGKFQAGIKKLVNQNVISPSIAARKFPNFIFVFPFE